MSEARKLVKIIDELEKQSEELNSAIDLYRKIDNLYSEISNTSLKYEKVFEDMYKAKSYLQETNKSIQNTLENINYEDKLDDICININKLNSSTTSLINNMGKMSDSLDYNIKFLRSDIKDINKNTIESKKTLLSLKDIVEQNKSDYNDKLYKELKKLEAQILLNQDIRKDIIIEELNSKLNLIEENYNKNMKKIYIGLAILVAISIINLFI